MNETQQQIVAVIVMRLRAMDEWEDLDSAIEAMDIISGELRDLTVRTRQRVTDMGTKR